MKNPIKKVITMNLLAASVLFLGGRASASDFNLSSISAADLRGTEFKAAPVARPQAPVSDSDDYIGLDLSIRVPFKALKKVMGMVAASDKDFSIIDPAAPVLERSGEFLKVENIRVNVNGIVVEPIVTLKPYFEGKDKIAIRVQRVQLHASMAPTPGHTGTPVALPNTDPGQPEFNKEDMMSDIMGIITKGITDALDQSLIENQSPLRAKDMLVFKYDKMAWTLHTTVSAAALKRYLPAGLVGDVHMTGIGLSDSAFTVKFETDK